MTGVRVPTHSKNSQNANTRSKRLYKVMVRLYGTETVAVTKTQEKRMEVGEMKMLRFP